MRIDGGTLPALTAAGVGAAPTGRATAKGRRVRFPRVHARLAQLYVRDGDTSLALDPGAASALASQGIAPGFADAGST